MAACSSPEPDKEDHRTGKAQKNFAIYEVYTVNEILPRLDVLINQKHPLFEKITLGDGPMFAIAHPRDTATVNEILKADTVRMFFPEDVKFAWSAEMIGPEQQKALGPGYYLYALKMPPNGPMITSEHIKKATPENDMYTGEPVISIIMTNEGGSVWSQMTGDNIDRFVAMTINDIVFSCPKVNGKISAGNTQISGHFSAVEAKTMARLIQP